MLPIDSQFVYFAAQKSFKLQLIASIFKKYFVNVTDDCLKISLSLDVKESGSTNYHLEVPF